jgi:hypothetical protein
MAPVPSYLQLRHSGYEVRRERMLGSVDSQANEKRQQSRIERDALYQETVAFFDTHLPLADITVVARYASSVRVEINSIPCNTR